MQQRLTAAPGDNHTLRGENQQLREQITVLLGQQRAATSPRRPQSRAIGPCS